MGRKAKVFFHSLDRFSLPELWKGKRLEIMFSAFRPGYFTYASSFGCWCYAYYTRPCGVLC